MAAMEEKTLRIVIVPSPGIGHLIPFSELAKLLVSQFNFSVTLLIPTLARPDETLTTFLSSLPSVISYTFLPLVDLNLIPEGAPIDITLTLIMARSLPAIRAALARLHDTVALVTDLFGSCQFEVARELGIPPYMYFTCSATYLLFCLCLPGLDETVSGEYRDMPDPVVLPGCEDVPILPVDLEDALQDRQGEAYRVVLEHARRYALAEGILVNTFLDLEGGAIRALEMEDSKWPPVYPIGPVIRSGSTHNGTEGKSESESGSDCLRWLDQHPIGSVLFVCFGSGGTLTQSQVNELAIGLEKSGQRFLWVVKRPNDETSFGSYFNGQGEDDPFDFLPEGILDRTKDRGLLVPNWAPQIEVLKHEAVGGFLTHCGWNSILESVFYGVPLITWPLFAEQRMNAVMLNEGLNVGLRPKANEHGVVEAGEISRIVKDLMEGEEGQKARHRMKELSDLAKKSICEDGNSSKEFEKVALKWKQNQTQES